MEAIRRSTPARRQGGGGGVFAAAVLFAGLVVSPAHAQTAGAGGACWQWIDAATGKPVPTGPFGWSPSGTDYFRGISNPDPNHVESPNHTSVRVPCPPPPAPPSTAAWNGAFGGIHLLGSFSRVGTSERIMQNNFQTNQFEDSGLGFGGGIDAGINWLPHGGPVLVGGVVTLSGLGDTVQHNFAGGGSIGSTVNVAASAELRAGLLVLPNLLLFGQTGVSIANQQLRIDFGGPVSSENRWTPGFTLGGGVELMLPPAVAPAGMPVSIFAAYHHTWWGDARLNGPAASPGFTYTWSRESDVLEVGARLHF